MNRRPGTTLTEVLMAIFIMGIGLMALLTLFPMGAIQMAQALKDQRAAEEAASAVGTLRVSWKRSYESTYRAVKFDPFDPSTAGYGNRATPPPPSPEWTAGLVGVESYVYALDDVYAAQRIQDTTGNPPAPRPSYPPPYTSGAPNPYPPYQFAPPANIVPQIPANAITPSYAVFVDPIGFGAFRSVGNADSQWFLGGKLAVAPQQGSQILNLRIPRRSLNAIEMATTSSDQSTLKLRYCYLTDDLAFDPTTGQPDPNTPRGGQYSVAWMIRRQTNVVRDQLNIVYVIVYRGRSMDVPSEELVLPADPNSNVVFGFDSTGQPTNTVSVAYTGARPPIRKGTWILDALDTSGGGINPTDVFYRVVAVEDGTRTIGSNVVPTLELELQTNHRRTYPGKIDSTGYIVILDKVVEVFEKRPIDSTTAPDFR